MGSTGIKLSCAASVFVAFKSDEASLPFRRTAGEAGGYSIVSSIENEIMYLSNNGLILHA